MLRTSKFPLAPREPLRGAFESLKNEFESRSTTKLALTPFFCLLFRVAFLELKDADDAETLVKRVNGFQFDAAHTFSCNRWTDFQIQDELSNTFVAPEVEENPAANVRILLFWPQ